MRAIDTKCEGEMLEDGTVTITLTISNLSPAEANQIGDILRKSVREAVLQVTKATKFEVRDMKAPTQ